MTRSPSTRTTETPAGDAGSGPGRGEVFFHRPSAGGIISQLLNIVSPPPLFAVVVWIGDELRTGKVGADDQSAAYLSVQR